jgi:hypothetical protein
MLSRLIADRSGLGMSVSLATPVRLRNGLFRVFDWTSARNGPLPVDMHPTSDRDELFEALITHLEQGLDLCIGQDRETASRLNQAD